MGDDIVRGRAQRGKCRGLGCARLLAPGPEPPTLFGGARPEWRASSFR